MWESSVKSLARLRNQEAETIRSSAETEDAYGAWGVPGGLSK